MAGVRASDGNSRLDESRAELAPPRALQLSGGGRPGPDAGGAGAFGSHCCWEQLRIQLGLPLRRDGARPPITGIAPTEPCGRPDRCRASPRRESRSPSVLTRPDAVSTFDMLEGGRTGSIEPCGSSTRGTRVTEHSDPGQESLGGGSRPVEHSVAEGPVRADRPIHTGSGRPTRRVLLGLVAVLVVAAISVGQWRAAIFVVAVVRSGSSGGEPGSNRDTDRRSGLSTAVRFGRRGSLDGVRSGLASRRAGQSERPRLSVDRPFER